jgi:dihydroorotase
VVGLEADVAVLKIEEGAFGFADTRGGRVDGSLRFECELTVRGGRVVWDRNARLATDYHHLAHRYGMRPVDFYLPPPEG